MQRLPVGLFLVCQTLAISGYGQEADSNRESSFVSATRVFAFYSDPLLNLHDFLAWNASVDQPIEPQQPCMRDLPSEERTDFEDAQAYYDGSFPEGQSFDPLPMAVRYELAGFADVEIVTDEEMAVVVHHLQAAMPAYRRCWWTVHDNRNREWIAELVPRLIAHEEHLRTRLSRLYRGNLDTPIPVDVVSYVSFGGANSVVAPDHVLVSSPDPANSGDSALEVVFHEASHTLLGNGRGAVWEALQDASTAAGLDRPPRDLWHTVLFYTTGKVVSARLLVHGVSDYEPYVYREGLFRRAWPHFQQPLERHWQPYLEDRVSMAEAARDLLMELSVRQ